MTGIFEKLNDEGKLAFFTLIEMFPKLLSAIREKQEFTITAKQSGAVYSLADQIGIGKAGFSETDLISKIESVFGTDNKILDADVIDAECIPEAAITVDAVILILETILKQKNYKMNIEKALSDLRKINGEG
jgi:hypothetical protein